MADVRLENVFKVYKNGVKAVKDFNLDIKDKEFIVFVGPSGCGKSTTLRMVAGLEDITSGKIYIDGRLVNDLQPKDRDISMVFQNYALYPHMTVYDNMAYGLRCRKTPKQIIDDKVREAARILGIEEYLERKPKELSGGQRQRVALGRAIVRQPKVFLLDEPLSNLDAKLRVQMRSEITKLHERIGTTFIYVTHDQTEAMTMGTRIVVMKDGIVQQVDSPSNLYEHPTNTFVATFLGSPQMNLFDGELLIEEDKVFFFAEDDKGTFKVEIPQNILLQIGVVTPHQKVLFGVRPGDMSVSENGIISTKIDLLEQLGNETIIYTYLPGREDFTICSMLSKDFEGEAKQVVSLDVDRNRIHLFDKETGESLSKLPEENRIILPLSQKENKWYLGDTPLVDSFSSTMIYEYTHNDVIVSFAPDKVKFERENDDLKLVVDVHHIAKFSQYYVYYATLATGERVIFTSSLKKELGKMDIYVSQEDLNYHDKETQEKFASHLLTETKIVEDALIQKIHGSHYFTVKNPGKGKQRMQRILKTDRLGTKMLILIESIQTGEKRLLCTSWNEDVYMGEITYLKD